MEIIDIKNGGKKIFINEDRSIWSANQTEECNEEHPRSFISMRFKVKGLTNVKSYMGSVSFKLIIIDCETNVNYLVQSKFINDIFEIIGNSNLTNGEAVATFFTVPHLNSLELIQQEN